MKIAKRILQQDDVFIALMAYRSTPVTSTGFSPSELIMGRKIRTIVPVKPSILTPRWPDLDLVRKRDKAHKQATKSYFDAHHGVRKLHPLGVGDQVRLKTDKEKLWTDKGTITQADYKGRSYMIDTGHGILRRNRRHVQHTGYNIDLSKDESANTSVMLPSEGSQEPTVSPPVNPAVNAPPVPQCIKPSAVTTRCGRVVKRPKRLDDYV